MSPAPRESGWRRVLRRLRLLPRRPVLVVREGDSGGAAAKPAPPGAGFDASPPTLFDTPPSLLGNTRKLFRSLLRRLRRNARGSRRGPRRRAVVNPYAGRNIRLVPYRPTENLLAPLSTVAEALRSGRRWNRRGGFLRRDDLLGWAKAERQSLTLILLVDVSRSTIGYLRVFAELLRSLAGHFQRNRDRMGLVSLQGRQASVLHHPTHNYRIVTRHLARLTFRGETPLADGLLKTLTMARLERFKNPGSQSLVVLLSDCCPEPIPPGHVDLFESEAYRDARSAAALFRRSDAQLLVLLAAPAHSTASVARGPSPGERLGAAIAEVSGGRLLRLPHTPDGQMPRGQIDLVLGAIDAMFQGGGARAGSERSMAGTGEWLR